MLRSVGGNTRRASRCSSGVLISAKCRREAVFDRAPLIGSQEPTSRIAPREIHCPRFYPAGSPQTSMTVIYPPVSVRSFGAQFRQLRIEAGLSLRLTARLAGISPTFLTDIEFDRRRPSREHFRTLARAVSRTEAELRAMDPRQGIEELIGFVTARPELAPVLSRICRRLSDGTMELKALENFARPERHR